MISESLTCAIRAGLFKLTQAWCCARISAARGTSSPGSGTLDCTRERSRASKFRASACKVWTACIWLRNEAIRSGSGTPACTRDCNPASMRPAVAWKYSMLVLRISARPLRCSKVCRRFSFLMRRSRLLVASAGPISSRAACSSSCLSRKSIRPLAYGASAEAGRGSLASKLKDPRANAAWTRDPICRYWASVRAASRGSTLPDAEPSSSASGAPASRSARAAAALSMRAAVEARNDWTWSLRSPRSGGSSDIARERSRTSRSRNSVSMAMLCS